MGFRAWIVVAAVIVSAPTQSPLGVLRLRITIVDADRNTRPVPRHALLVSQNPSSAAPQRLVTAADGTAEMRLRPGNYTVESDEPLVFQGQAYQWARTVDITAGQTIVLDLTTDSAQIEAAATVSASPSYVPAAGSASALLLDWQNSVVSIWSPTALGAGFVIDSRGLIATNQRLVGRARVLEVQISSSEKFAARVLASDPDKNVAILWVDPKAIAAARPVKLGYAESGKPPADKDKLFAITTAIRDAKSTTSGTVSRVMAHTLRSDVRVDDDSLGAPLFNPAGEVVAITAPDDGTDTGAGYHAVRIDEARGVIAAAERKMATTDAPDAARRPVDPIRPFEDDALKEAAKRRAGSLAPYRIAAADFDVSLITPVLVYASRHQGEGGGRDTGGVRSATDMPAALRALQGFENWDDYVRNDPPVLMVRATPKLVESLWKTLGRVAAQSQGVQIPAMKHIKAGFASMRMLCGAAEVTPIHPFKIEQRVGENDVVYEGLYVFDPASVGPHCGTVTLVLFSDKDPDKGDSRVVEPGILRRIRDDFAPYRTGAAEVPR